MTWYGPPEQYARPEAVPAALSALAGPHGLALVDVYDEGRTTGGWGLEPREATADRKASAGFMANYKRRRFWAKPRLMDFAKGSPFAIVMRSVNVIAVDIDRHLDDGGADGFKAAATLGLTPTLAETSKSGEGRHLFYRTDEQWDPATGFGAMEDVIGLAPGVDIRAVGCVYHYPTQRWNDLPLAPVPDTLLDKLNQRRARKTAARNLLAAAAAASPDAEEALIMHDTLLQELNRPIAAGKRNNTLFAIGSQMKESGYPNWEAEVARRASEIGIDHTEADKIISNISAYGS